MHKKKPVPPLQLISRSGVKHILNELPTNSFLDEKNRPSLEAYTESLKKVKAYLSVTKKQNAYIFNPMYEKVDTIYFECEKQDIKTKGLTPRQDYLAGLILKYIAGDISDNISHIYHELYDYIDNYNDPAEQLYYSEILMFDKLLDTVINTLEEAVKNQGNKLYQITIQEDSDIFTYFEVSPMSREELIQDIWNNDSYGLISVEVKEVSEIDGFKILLKKQ